MADYKLTATQTGGDGARKLRIKWNYTLPYEATLYVHRGGDYKMIYSKSYKRGATSDDITIDVPWYGEFKVELKLASPAIGSHVIYPSVKMTGSVQAKTFVYDKAAVEKAKFKQEIVLAATTILGSLRLVGTIFTVYFGSTAITSTNVDFPAPKVGDKVDVTFIAQSSGGARVETRFTQIPYTDSNGNSQSGQVVTKNSYIAFVAYSR